MIIFVGSPIIEEQCCNYQNISIAGNKMQLGFIRGFINNGVKTVGISVAPRAMRLLKKNKEPYIERKRTIKSDHIIINQIGYINIPVVKQFSIYRSIYKTLQKIISENKSEEIIICVYNTISYIALPCIKIGRKFGLTCTCIVADVPLQTTHKHIFRIWENKKEISLISKFDSLIPLSKHVVEDFAPNLPYVVVEAGTEELHEPIEKTINEINEYNIVYTGSLNIVSGMELVIEIARVIKNPKVFFHIYGDGEYQKTIKKAETDGLPIIYHGRVKYEEALAVQSGAAVLICPRLPDNFVTRYTFPSKVLEYMSMGVPVICNALEGIPEEYREYINIVDNAVASAWVETIEKILDNYSFYKEKAVSAQKHIGQNKNWDIQTKRVIDTLWKRGIIYSESHHF